MNTDRRGKNIPIHKLGDKFLALNELVNTYVLGKNTLLIRGTGKPAFVPLDEVIGRQDYTGLSIEGASSLALREERRRSEALQVTINEYRDQVAQLQRTIEQLKENNGTD